MRALLVSNMKASEENPAVGSFVRTQFEALQRIDGVDVELHEFAPAGGAPAAWDPLSGGSFYQPTVLVDVADDNPAAQREAFGPMASLMKFDTVDEALARANSTEFGLSAQVWGNDAGAIQHLVQNLEAGAVWVNCTNRTRCWATVVFAWASAIPRSRRCRCAPSWKQPPNSTRRAKKGVAPTTSGGIAPATPSDVPSDALTVEIHAHGFNTRHLDLTGRHLRLAIGLEAGARAQWRGQLARQLDPLTQARAHAQPRSHVILNVHAHRPVRPRTASGTPPPR